VVISEYKQVKISVSTTLANAFREACITQNMSMTGVLSKFMMEFSKTTQPSAKSTPNYTTKRHRRMAIASIIKQLEMIKAGEEQYISNIPDNLQGSVVFENAEQSLAIFEETLDLLASY
jgi:hypothetical protein